MEISPHFDFLGTFLGTDTLWCPWRVKLVYKGVFLSDSGTLITQFGERSRPGYQLEFFLKH